MVKIPAATTAGARAIARPDRAEQTAGGSEKLAVPNPEKGRAAAGAVDTFEKAVPTAIGGLLGGRREVWAGGFDPTLQASADQIDTSAASGSPVEHERATIPGRTDHPVDPSKASVPETTEEPPDHKAAAPTATDEPPNPDKAADTAATDEPVNSSESPNCTGEQETTTIVDDVLAEIRKLFGI